MGCGCGGGRKRNASSGRTRTVTPQAAGQLRPAQSVVRAQGLPSEPPGVKERQEIERKRKIQISLRKRNGPQ